MGVRLQPGANIPPVQRQLTHPQVGAKPQQGNPKRVEVVRSLPVLWTETGQQVVQLVVCGGKCGEHPISQLLPPRDSSLGAARRVGGRIGGSRSRTTFGSRGVPL